MAKKKRCVFLSDKFYNTYPSAQYPEMEQKQNRPYIQVYVEIGGVQYAIPLRSDIHHPHVLWTDKANHCGVDFSKAVVIKDETYIESYKKAKKDLSKPVNQNLVKYSTLQYFEEEIGL